MMKLNSFVKTCLIVCLSIGASACGDPAGGIPKAYRGVFEQGNIRLDIVSSAGRLEIDGKTLEAKASPISYASLVLGTPGFYNEVSAQDSTLMDVYWITPDTSTKREEGGMIFYTTDIIYMQINLTQTDPVGSIEIVHSAKGEVELDSQTQQWQIGWPMDPETISVVRTAAKSSYKPPKK